MATDLLADRVDRLVALVRALSREQIKASIEAQEAKRPGSGPKPDPEAFWLAGGGNVRLTPDEESALGDLWTRMWQTLAMSVGPDDLQGSDRFGRLKRLHALVEKAGQGLTEAEATTLLDASYGDRVSAGVLAIWNALGAGLVAEKLKPELIASLELAWREAVGDPPRELLTRRE